MIENYQDNTLRIFNSNVNRPLAEKIVVLVGAELGKGTVRQFSDGEIQINTGESTRGDHVHIVQTTDAPVNDRLMESFILIDTLERASAKTVSAILPYYGYARQGRIARPRGPITARLVANMLIEADAVRLLTLDLHTVQVRRLSGIPVDNLFAMLLFAYYYRQQALVGEGIMIVLSENNGVQHARSLSEYLDVILAIVDHGKIDGVCQRGCVIENVAGKKCTLVDDVLNTGQTLATTAGVLMKNDAQEVYACASHGLLLEDAKITLEDTPIKGISITDSVYATTDRQPATLSTISCAESMGEALLRIHKNKPMSPLFRLEPKGE